VSGADRIGEFYGDLDWASGRGACEIRAMAASGREDDVDTHTHEQAHFVLVLSGIYLSSARGAPSFAPSPFLVFNPVGTTHRDRFMGGVGSFVTLSLKTGALAGVPDVRLGEVAVAMHQSSAIAAAFRIAREVRGPSADAVAVESAIWELLAGARPAPATHRDLLPAWAHRAYEAIMDRAAEGSLSVGAVAADVGVHPVHLARVFRRAWGCSPGELLRWRRVQATSHLLLRTRLPAAEIAVAVGFVDQSHMTRAFRTAFGLTPGAWRRAHGVAPIQSADPLPA
jgi:AraC family transcriptional regulator